MEKKTLKCPHCQQMNYPMVEFCHHCGESLHIKSVDEKQTLIEKWFYHAVDAMFWLVDETARWWEIGKLTIKLKALRRQRARLLSHFESLDKSGGETSLEQRQTLMGITEELARLSSREEFLRTRCWELIPEFFFLIIFLLFCYGLFVFSPGGTMLPQSPADAGVFSGQVSKVRDLPLKGHSVISRVVYHKEKLYIGGDGGVTVVDPVTGKASETKGLPDDFYVRDMVVRNDELIIGGFPGIYSLKNTSLQSLYKKNQLPADLVNSLALTEDGKLLVGTIAKGVLRGNKDSAVFILGTQGKTVRDFGRLDSELWIMHEDGILTGSNNSFEPVSLQVLAGRHLRSMVTTERSVYIGSDQGVIAGYRNARNWVWTLLSAGKPGFVNDLFVSGDVLFVGSDEGLYRFKNGRMERLSSIPCQALAAGKSFLAAVNSDSILLCYFAPFVSVKDGPYLSSVPEVGSYTPSMPVVSMIPVPDLQFGRLPDFQYLENKLEQNEESATDSTASESEGDIVPETKFPPELQTPVFSDLQKVNDYYYMATLNRGIWLHHKSSWKRINGVPSVGLGALAGSNEFCYAYGPGEGVYKIKQDSARLFIKDVFTNGLLDINTSKDGSLVMLFEDGEIKTSDKNGKLETLTSIPGDFKGEFHSIWKMDSQLVVVVNRGVLIQESRKQWNLVFFKGGFEGSKVTVVTRGPGNALFIGVNDGRIFKLSGTSLDFVGTISDQPVAMNFAGYLWVAGKESLYFLEKNKLIATPFHVNDKILGAYPVPDSKSIMVFTGSGIKLIAGR
ncbi:MAG: hypothetical protein ACQETH_05990 [Candidatus Rifleibacteriota bacterium]